MSIRNSVNDVQFTLMLTAALVVLVIFLFLRNVTATIIPALALPVSVIGTFAGMYVMGYSIDNLSLLALDAVGRDSSSTTPSSCSRTSCAMSRAASG